jgi:hypothetical protein
MRAGRRKKAQRVAVGLVALDLMVAVAVLAHSGLAQVAAKTVPANAMSSRHLEQILERTAQRKDDPNRSAFLSTCASDPNRGWDYYCTGSDGARGLYDVSASKITAASIIQR